MFKREEEQPRDVGLRCANPTYTGLQSELSDIPMLCGGTVALKQSEASHGHAHLASTYALLLDWR